MKKLFSKILFSISLLFFLQNHALSQNIFDELKKAGEQLQKEIDKPDTKQKPPASGAQQPASPKTPASGAQQPASPKTPPAVQTTNAKNYEHNFTLFGQKIGEPIKNAKLTGKSYNQILCLYWVSVNCREEIYPFSNQLFTPSSKNEMFDEYILTYGAYTQEIVGIYARTKKTFKTSGECSDILKDPLKFIEEKLGKENPTWKIIQSESTASERVFALDTIKKGIGLYSRCDKDNQRGTIVLRKYFQDPSSNQLIASEYLKAKDQSEQNKFDKKKGTGELKGF